MLFSVSTHTYDTVLDAKDKENSGGFPTYANSWFSQKVDLACLNRSGDGTENCGTFCQILSVGEQPCLLVACKPAKNEQAVPARNWETVSVKHLQGSTWNL